MEASRDGRHSVEGEGVPVTPGTLGEEGAGVGVRVREGEVARERNVDVPLTAERPVTVDTVEGVTLGREGTTARVIEGVEVNPVQIDSLFRL